MPRISFEDARQDEREDLYSILDRPDTSDLDDLDDDAWEEILRDERR